MDKKAALTDPFTLLFIVFIVGLFSLGLLFFGQDLVLNHSDTLDTQSVVHIAEQTGYKVDGNYINGTLTESDITSSFYLSSLNESGDNIKDNAYEFLFYRDKSSSISGYLQSLYNMPSYFISNLGLDLGSWAWVINSISYIIFIIILIAGTKFIRGILR